MLARLFERQLWHLILLTILLGIVYFIAQAQADMFVGSLWGVSSFTWFIIALAIPIIQQILVVVVWRIQLETQGITDRFPKYGFHSYVIAFLVLLIGRPISALLLAIANRGTLNIVPMLLYSVALIFTVLVAYLMVSLIRYFGIIRATGADHFYSEYRDMPLVKEGIFKYTSNGMYIFGLLITWIPGLLFASQASLLVAIFSHVYIWVHYYCTEKPDMQRIYAQQSEPTPS